MNDKNDPTASTESPSTLCCASLILRSPSDLPKAWNEAGNPTGQEYVQWAESCWKANVSETDGDWNAALRKALGGRAQPEQMVCRIF